jgi:hypothetical protein
LVELRTLLSDEIIDTTLMILRLIDAWIVAAMEVPLDVEPSDIADICKAIYEDDSLGLKVALFGLLKAVVEKGLPDFVFELIAPELIPMIFDAAGWQADDVLEPFLKLFGFSSHGSET